jgi:hypothetical protein
MKVKRTLTVHVVPGVPRVGLWCDEHLLPHRWECNAYAMTGKSLNLLGTYSGCDDDEDDERG